MEAGGEHELDEQVVATGDELALERAQADLRAGDQARSDGDIVAEGRLSFGVNTKYFSSDVTFIEIKQVGTFGDNDVQNIEKVKIVVLGGDPTLQD